MYIVLGVLYESFIHPITILSTLPSAGVGALLALTATGDELDVIAIIGHHSADRHREEERHHDDRFRARGASASSGLSPRDAIYQRLPLRFRPILMTTMAAILGALPLMLGTGVGFGAAPAARRRHRRRPAPQPGADAVHDAGDLSLLWIASRSGCSAGDRAPRSP